MADRPLVPDIPLTRKILYSVIVVVVVFGTPELLLRAFWVPPTPASREVGTRRFVTWLSDLAVGKDRGIELYRDDASLLWRLRSGARLDSFNYHCAKDGELQPIRMTINNQGHRGESVPAKKTALNSTRVLCMGDSNFFGYPLDDADVFPRLLAQAMQREMPGKRVEVINGGVPGYSVLQGRRLYEQVFSRHEYDWLLLSYLNNDAWLQPHADRDLFRARASLVGRFAHLGNSIYLVRFGRSLLGTNKGQPAKLVPRVSLEEFVGGYREFIAADRARGAQVMIVDYRAYAKYEPYSSALRDLATAEGVGYVSVAALTSEAVARGKPESAYADRASRVLRRWGATLLGQRPYLWYYAEYSPEHLNEVGTAWLSDVIAPLLRERAQ